MSSVYASILLLTYNQKEFIADALESLLNQDYENLEIVISDDFSSDETWEKIIQISQTYRGLKKIILNRNSENIGVVANYFTAFALSKGEVIFTAAGDDISLLNRCSVSIEKWIDSGKKFDLIAADGFDMLIDGRCVGIKKIDNLEKWTLTLWSRRRPYMFGASHMLTRRMLDLRILSPDLQVEDQCLVIRAIMMGGALRCAVPLIKHRRGGVSQTKYRWTYELKKEKLIASSKQALLECDEVMKDGVCLDINMAPFLESNKAENQYVIKLLNSLSFYDKTKFLFSSKNISIRKKWKFYSYASFHYLYKLGYFLKSISFNK